MSLQTPSNAVRLSKDHEAMEPGGLHVLFGMRRASLRQCLQNLSARPGATLLIETAAVLSECSGFEVEVNFVQQMLELYPGARVTLAMVGSARDSDVRDTLCDAFSDALLGCTWPQYRDRVDIDEFTELLKKQYDLLQGGV